MSIKVSKTLSLLVVFILLIGMAGCTPSTPTTAAATEVSQATSAPSAAATATSAPAKAEKLSFTVTTLSFGLDPMDPIKEVQKLWLEKSAELMGRELDIKFQFVNEMDYQEKIKVTLASGDLPDLITLDWLSQAEIVKYGDAGLFVDLSQYLDKMPNYKKLLDEAPSSAPKLFSKEGKLYAVYSASTNNLVVDGGHDMNFTVGIRTDIFEKHNIAIPTTIDELTDAARKLKAIYPEKFPIAPNSSWETPWSILASANRCAGWDNFRYYDGTAFQYAPLQECMKDSVTTMNQWVNEKLIAPDYMSFTDAQGTAALAAGDAMILPGFWYGYPGFWETQFPEQKWAMVTGIKNPKYGEPVVYSTYTKDATGFISNYSVAISAKSKHIDELVRFLDLQLSQEISDLQNWGIEGKTYKVTDGVKNFLPDYVAAQSDTNNPLNAANLCVGTGTCRPGIFPQIQDALANEQGWPQQDSIVDGKLIRGRVTAVKRDSFRQDQENPASMLGMNQMTTDQSNEYANIMTPIDTYAKEQIAQFIMGNRPMSDWDKFVEEIKAMGDIQKALDLYNSHIKK